jgi:hypothetical protein
MFIGNKSELFDHFDFTENAKSKLKKANIKQITPIEILDKYKADGGTNKWPLSSMLFKEPKDIELVALERQKLFLAMTFKLNDSPILPDKDEMMCSVVFRYYQPHDKTLWKQILRKLANAAPFCSHFGTTGKWLVVDYSYTYNQNDYSIWYLREGDAYHDKEKKKTSNFIDKLRSQKGRQEFMDKALNDLSVLEMWASAWVEKYPQHVDEELYNATKQILEQENNNQ